MKKKNLVPLLGIAFIVAVVATGVFYGLFVGRLNSAVPGGPGSTRLLVAARDLKAGAVVSEGDVKFIPWVVPGVPEGAVTEPKEVVGKVVVNPVGNNDLVHRSDLASESGGDVLSGSLGIPDGMRAVSLQVQDSSGVIAMLKPGHRVDVQVVGTLPGTRGMEPHLRTILENVQVLTMPKENSGVRAGSHIITVLASPEDAAVLGLADSSAKVRLALRNPIDAKKQARNSVALGSLFKDGVVAAGK